MDNLPILLGEFIPYKTLKIYKVNAAQVKVKPINLPKPSKATYTMQRNKRKNTRTFKGRYHRKREILSL